ncbi:MAG TPA: hypothetical protein ENN67_06790, partial [Firmicutes bacterium]|nr:hypothetical protein [Bacillota bacterium]
MRLEFLPIFAVCIILLGCSGAGDKTPVIPDITSEKLTQNSSHQLWGLWQFTADPENGTLDY